MFGKYHRCVRWIMLIASGAIVFQAVGCDLILQGISTGLLATLTGVTLFLASNV